MKNILNRVHISSLVPLYKKMKIEENIKVIKTSKIIVQGKDSVIVGPLNSTLGISMGGASERPHCPPLCSWHDARIKHMLVIVKENTLKYRRK